MSVITPIPHESVNLRWIALLGQRDIPTDGVEDYCTFLGRALAARGIDLKQARVQWTQKGWIGALRQLSRECVSLRGRWILLQYTALGWSRRGFPFASLLVLAILRGRGARVAVVFHEPFRQGGSRWVDRIRGVCQDWVIHGLYKRATKAIFTIPLEAVPWLPQNDHKAAFIPIGGSLPECLANRLPPAPDGTKTVIIFGVTGAPTMVGEVEEIAAIMREASRILKKLRLIVIGRGSFEAREQLAKALEKCNVELMVRGVLPAKEVAHEFESADALLFVRGAIRLQRSSAIAAIACGLPIVGYDGGDIIGPLKEAGIEWSTRQDRDGLTLGLIRVLNDPERWMELHERNIQAQKNYFSWSRIAERYRMILTA